MKLLTALALLAVMLLRGGAKEWNDNDMAQQYHHLRAPFFVSIGV
jgi:hypothetical protein